MAIVIKPITLEVSKPNVFQAIAAKQGDSNSRFIKATIANDGIMIPVLPTSTVTINAKRVDGQSESFFGEANEDGTATVPIHSWMLELVGYVNCDVSIIDIEGRKLTTTSFTLLVEEASHNSDDVSEEEQYDFIAALSEEVMSRIASKAEQSEVDGIQEEIAEINEKISNFDGGGSTVTNTASGEVIALTDISPIEHTLEVKARSINLTTAEEVYKGRCTRGTDAMDGRNYIYFTAGGTLKNAPIEFKPNTQYTVSFSAKNVNTDGATTTSCAFAFFYTDNSYQRLNVTVGSEWKPFSLTSEINKTVQYVGVYISTSKVTTYLDSDTFMFVEGATVKDYVPHDVSTASVIVNDTTTYPIKADGTVEGVTSIYPTTTLISDTEGVVLDVEYKADTKKYIDNKFAELAAMIVNS